MNHRTLVCVLLPALIALTAGCTTTPAPDFKGRWKAVNRYADTPQEIPLHQSYVFHPSPMDGTLKNMLERWAKDSKMELSYLHPSDFTLHAAVASIHTSNLQEATSQLTSAYAQQGVGVATENNKIVVRAMSIAAAMPATGSAAMVP